MVHRDIDKIMAFLRPQQVAGVPPMVRQTLLFSATFSEEVREVAAQTLRPGYKVCESRLCPCCYADWINICFGSEFVVKTMVEMVVSLAAA